MMRGTVIIFVKAPRAGAVKTRLGADIGLGRAAALFRIMTASTIAQSTQGSWRTMLAVDPDWAIAGFDNLWPPHLMRMAQGRGDLGCRMARAFDKKAPGPVVIIGADAPELRARHLRAAFDALRGADAVFGPAADGGYWLVGLSRRRAAPDLFGGVRWSTKHALADTVKTLPRAFHVAYLKELQDVDEKCDLSAMGPRTTAI